MKNFKIPKRPLAKFLY